MNHRSHLLQISKREEDKKDIPVINNEERVLTEDTTEAFNLVILIGISIGIMVIGKSRRNMNND